MNAVSRVKELCGLPWALSPSSASPATLAGVPQGLVDSRTASSFGGQQRTLLTQFLLVLPSDYLLISLAVPQRKPSSERSFRVLMYSTYLPSP